MYATDYWSCSMPASKYFFSNRIINSTRHHIINNAIQLQHFQYDEENNARTEEILNSLDTEKQSGRLILGINICEHSFRGFIIIQRRMNVRNIYISLHRI